MRVTYDVIKCAIKCFYKYYKNSVEQFFLANFLKSGHKDKEFAFYETYICNKWQWTGWRNPKSNKKVKIITLWVLYTKKSFMLNLFQVYFGEAFFCLIRHSFFTEVHYDAHYIAFGSWCSFTVSTQTKSKWGLLVQVYYQQRYRTPKFQLLMNGRSTWCNFLLNWVKRLIWVLRKAFLNFILQSLILEIAIIIR